ncbi:hypothetical protein GWK08_04170 [Leptobacterium flavescens]|uniref:TonB-dependent receptor plug domain-containing protein n=1 Tax=Leptobacterium flavescens TaxID=472055 RepID=A0A6P0UHA2_9FLAO|nr:hypothetical protein [Leptobacterium flavescens]NER12624.1 hypothetical protein [Leptobacterium flavescens]
MKKLLIIIILLTTGLQAMAQDAFRKDLFSANVVLKYRVEINLSEQKVNTIKKIYDEHTVKFNSLKWDLDAEQLSLNKQLESSRVDEKASLAQMEKVVNLENQLKQLKLKMLIKIKNELTVSQQEKLKELRTDEDLKSKDVVVPVNENPRIMIRGNAGKLNSNPLYVLIDKKGERKISAEDFRILNLKPDRIVSVSVLKGNAAWIKYGSDGKNGVIVIQVKD